MARQGLLQDHVGEALHVAHCLDEIVRSFLVGSRSGALTWQGLFWNPRRRDSCVLAWAEREEYQSGDRSRLQSRTARAWPTVTFCCGCAHSGEALYALNSRRVCPRMTLPCALRCLSKSHMQHRFRCPMKTHIVSWNIITCPSNIWKRYDSNLQRRDLK